MADWDVHVPGTPPLSNYRTDSWSKSMLFIKGYYTFERQFLAYNLALVKTTYLDINLPNDCAAWCSP
jgi:hypothetical protein